MVYGLGLRVEADRGRHQDLDELAPHDLRDVKEIS